MVLELSNAPDFERLNMGDEIVVGNYSYRVRDRFPKRSAANGAKEQAGELFPR